MSRSKSKRLVIRNEPEKYVLGKDSKTVTLSFKVFMRKRQKKASKVFRVTTTVGELRNNIYFFGIKQFGLSV